MKKNLIVALVLTVLCVIAVDVSSAAEGWSMSKLNPFSKAKLAGPARARSSDSGWKLPSLWQKTTRPAPRPAPAGPTTWQKMTSGTKSAVSKTADFLNPFNDGNEAAPPPSATGYNSPFSQASTRKKPDDGKSGSIPEWLWGGSEPEEEKRPETVNDFLARPRPQF